MNGQVIRCDEEKEFKEIQEKADQVFNLFYNGMPLTYFEKDLE